MLKAWGRIKVSDTRGEPAGRIGLLMCEQEKSKYGFITTKSDLLSYGEFSIEL